MAKRKSEQDADAKQDEFIEYLKQKGFSDENLENLLRPATRTEAPTEAFIKFAQGTVPTFAELARISSSKANHFSHWITQGFDEWRDDADILKHSSEHGFHDLVANVRRKIAMLCRDLEKMNQFLQHRPLVFIARTGTPRFFHEASFVGPLVITRLLKELSDLKDELNYDELGHARKLGRPRGTRRYPGLEQLVWTLEAGAQLCGGKFTLDRTCGKGTLIRGLDWFRAHCLEQAEWKWLAEDLPSPGRHPLAVYESAILAARKFAEEYRALR